MKSFVCIALVVFLGIVAAQGYGPKINRKPYEGGHRPFHRPFNRPPPVGPHHRPPPPNKGGYWDKSPKWGDRSDSGDSSYGSFGSDDSSGPDSSFEDSGYWHDHHHPKHPCKHPYTKKPPKPTFKTTTPTPTTTPRPTTTVSPTPKTPSTTASTTKWETTTNSVTTTEEAFTTISPKTQKCIDRCLSTPEYNPVCGSNGLTYDNEGKLFCAASCGVNVTLRRRSVCPPPNWDYDDEDETTGTATAPPPTTTTTPYIGRTTSMTNLQRCMKQCHASALFKPVCGSDFATYMNIDRLKCAQSCGEVVEVLCEKPCAACGITPVTPKTTTTTLRTTTTPQIGRTTQKPDIEKCIKDCPVTPEYNPVCGSNGYTYSNPGRLLCSQLCGLDVRAVRLGPCGSRTTSTTTTQAPPTPTTRSPAVLSCIRRCPVTSEYNPVCGSDGLTYTNPGNLECAKFCGVVVEVLCKKSCAACGITPVTPQTTTTTLRTTTTPQIGRTTQKPDIEKCIKDCPVTPEYNPVCGSNGYTYSNPGRLRCSQMCGLDVRAVRSGPCGSRTTSTTTTQAPPTPTTRSPAVLSCIRRCPVTSEYNPVCGSDGLTYTNPGNLECAKFCGVAVAFKHKSRCVDELDIGPDESTTLQTTREINENKEPATTPSTTMKPTTPTTTPTSTKNPDPNSSSTLGFTIPDDVLDNIFGSTTTQVPITKPTNPDDDEDLDLDTRFSTLKNRTEIVKV